MSGPENLRGIDYQVSCSVLLILSTLADESSPLTVVHVESLDDEGEDLALEFQDGRVLQIQLKKLAEGYNWTPAGLRPVLSRFSRLDKTSECLFISDGSASRQFTPLRQFLEGTGDLTDEERDSVCGDGLSAEDLEALRGRVRIQTRFFPSPDDADPARYVTGEIHRLLLRGPFSLEKDATDIAAGLWRTLYDAGSAALTLPRDSLLSQFAQVGLRLIRSDWAVYPTAPRFYKHTEPAEEIAEVLRTGGIALIFGIGGSGKTTLGAEAASLAAADRRTCWLRVSEFVDPSDIVRVLAEYCTKMDLPLVAESLRIAEPVKLPGIAADVFSKFPVAAVLDRFEAASPRLASFVREMLSALPSTRPLGSLVITSRSLPEWWSDFELDRTGVLRVSLAGLPHESAIAMLQDFGVGQNDDERRELVESLGFHAQSLALLRQVQGGPNAGMPRQGGVQAARDWLLRRVLDELPEREKRAIARLSIFDYPARLDLVEVVLDELGPDSLRALQRRDLLRIDMGCVTIHDAVRGVGLELISRSTVEACHRAVANRLFSELVHDHEREGSVLYEKGIHWAVHLESSGDVSDLGGRFSLILNSDATFLRALFGVSYLGFPYEFEDPSLDHAVELIEELEEKALIEEDPANDGKPFMEGPALLLRDFNYFEDILIRALCFHHGYAGQVGYMAEMRPNFAFRQQGLLCPWEHCIELSPLPMSSRAEWEESLEEDRRRLADPAAHNLSNKHIEVIQARLEEGVPEWVPEEVDYELRARSCPVFGHACPGGQAQAETCRTRGHFEWATDPRN